MEKPELELIIAVAFTATSAVSARTSNHHNRRVPRHNRSLSKCREARAYKPVRERSARQAHVSLVVEAHSALYKARCLD